MTERAARTERAEQPERLWDGEVRTFVASSFGHLDPKTIPEHEMDAAAKLARAHRDQLTDRGAVISGRLVRRWGELDCYARGSIIVEALTWYRSAVRAGLVDKRNGQVQKRGRRK